MFGARLDHFFGKSRIFSLTAENEKPPDLEKDTKECINAICMLQQSWGQLGYSHTSCLNSAVLPAVLPAVSPISPAHDQLSCSYQLGSCLTTLEILYPEPLKSAYSVRALISLVKMKIAAGGD